MSDLLDLSRKMQRALAHAKLLKYRTTRFLESEANGVTHDFDSEPGYLIVKAHIGRPLPPSLAILTGESLYQLRSVLNHLVWHLSEVNSGKRIYERCAIEFPIRDSPTGKGSTRWWGDRIGLLTPTQQTVVKGEQPYVRYKNAPESDPLWLLYELSDYDRHRSLHTTIVTTSESTFAVVPPDLRSAYRMVGGPTFGPVDGDTEVVRFEIVHKGPQTTVQVESQARFNITFAQGTPAAAGYPVVSTIGAIAIRVYEIFEALSSA